MSSGAERHTGLRRGATGAVCTRRRAPRIAADITFIPADRYDFQMLSNRTRLRFNDANDANVLTAPKQTTSVSFLFPKQPSGNCNVVSSYLQKLFFQLILEKPVSKVIATPTCGWAPP